MPDKAVKLTDRENAELIGGLANARDQLRRDGFSGDGVQAALDKINSLMAPDIVQLTITAQTYEEVRDEGRAILIDEQEKFPLSVEAYNMLRMSFYHEVKTIGDLSKLTKKQLQYRDFPDEIIEEIQKTLDLYYLGMDRF